MKRRMVGGLLLFLGAITLAGALQWYQTRQVMAEPEVFSSPINAGCYIAAPDVCKIHVDPFTININDGALERLVLFRLYANGSLIYDFRTDTSNPPAADYSPSLVMQDFAATCGETYVLNMVAQDTGDLNPLNAGQTTAFTCPSGVP